MDELEALGVLAEPQRARIHRYLATAGPRTRNEISQALDLGRTLVAFHLHKLEQAGLVETGDRETKGRRGRPAQHYRLTRRELSASVPPRRYELLAAILLRAAKDQRPAEPFADAATRAAEQQGRELARQDLWPLLGDLGFEPVADGPSITLTNCPFQRMRAVDAELVCAINEGLATGYLAADDAYSVRRRPCPENCCVVLEPA